MDNKWALHNGMPFHSGLWHVYVSPSSIRGLNKDPIRWFRLLKRVTCPWYIRQVVGGMWYNDGTEWDIKGRLQATCHSKRVAMMREAHTWLYKCRREQIVLHELPRPLFFHPSSYAFFLWLIFLHNYLGLQGMRAWCVGYNSRYPVLRWGISLPTRAWDNHGFLNVEGLI